MASFFQSLSPHVHYIPGGVNMALVVYDHQAIVIDTGQNKNSGRQLRQACEQLEATPVAIVNTHAHADHYGGNAYLLRQFDVPVYAPPLEAQIMQSPMLEPIYLFNGAKPLTELTSQWLLAKPSRVDVVLEPGPCTIAGIPLTILDTSGHAHVQYSVIAGGVLLAADALFGSAVLEKYPLPFGQDIARQRQSMQDLRHYVKTHRTRNDYAKNPKDHTEETMVCLPGHGEPTTDIDGLITANLTVINRAAAAVLAACEVEASTDSTTTNTTDAILQRVCDTLNLTLTDLPRYALNRCTVLAHLSYWHDQGMLEPIIHNNVLCWHRA